MPVYKFKTFYDASRAQWNFYPDAAYLKNVSDLWNFANKLSPMVYPQGIFKYRTLEDANKERQKWELEHAREALLNRKK